MNLLSFGMPGPMEMAIIGVIAVLLFGARLPQVAKSFGQSIMSFKKGFKEVELEVAEMERVGQQTSDELRAGATKLKEEVVAKI